MEVWCLIALVSSGHCILPKIWPLGHCVLWLVWGMCNTGLGYCILSAVDDHGSMMEVVEIWESRLLAAGIACSAFSESYLYLRFCVVQCASLCRPASKLLMRVETNITAAGSQQRALLQHQPDIVIMTVALWLNLAVVWCPSPGLAWILLAVLTQITSDNN